MVSCGQEVLDWRWSWADNSKVKGKTKGMGKGESKGKSNGHGKGVQAGLAFRWKIGENLSERHLKQHIGNLHRGL